MTDLQEKENIEISLRENEWNEKEPSMIIIVQQLSCQPEKETSEISCRESCQGSN